MRRNIALCIVFSIITFGIYEIYWFIVATNEINRMTRHPNQTSGGIAFLLSLITFGIYSYYWAWKLGEKSDMLKNCYLEYRSTDTRILYLVLQLFGFQIINLALVQYEFNKADDIRRGNYHGEYTCPY